MKKCPKTWWKGKIVINGITVWSGKKPKKLIGLDILFDRPTKGGKKV